MKKDESIHVMNEIHSIPRFKRMIETKQKELEEVAAELKDIGSPQSPNKGTTIKPMKFNPDGTIVDYGEQIKEHGHGMTQEQRILSLLTDEQELMDVKIDIELRLKKAERYRREVEIETGFDDFIIDYMDGVPYRDLKQKYYIENPYQRMLTIMKGIEVNL